VARYILEVVCRLINASTLPRVKKTKLAVRVGLNFFNFIKNISFLVLQGNTNKNLNGIQTFN